MPQVAIYSAVNAATYGGGKLVAMRTAWWVEVNEPHVVGSIDREFCEHVTQDWLS